MALIERAHAVDGGTANTWDFLTGNTAPGTGADWQVLVGNIINLILIVAGALAIIYLIYSGIIYITAGGNPDNAKKGQQGVINAIIGIVIIVLAYFIANAAVTLGTSVSTP